MLNVMQSTYRPNRSDDICTTYHHTEGNLVIRCIDTTFMKPDCIRQNCTFVAYARHVGEEHGIQ